MSAIMANSFAAHLNASACRHSILPRSQPKVNDPTVFSTPSFLILSAIYFCYKYDCDKTRFLACHSLFQRALTARKKEKKRSKRPAEKTNCILTEKEGLQSTLLDLIISAVRPTASSSYAVIMTSPLPGNLNLMTLLNSSMNRVKESVRLQQGTKTCYPHIPRFEHFQEKKILLFTLHIVSVGSLSSTLCPSYKILK